MCWGSFACVLEYLVKISVPSALVACMVLSDGPWFHRFRRPWHGQQLGVLCCQFIRKPWLGCLWPGPLLPGCSPGPADVVLEVPIVCLAVALSWLPKNS